MRIPLTADSECTHCNGTGFRTIRYQHLPPERRLCEECVTAVRPPRNREEALGQQLQVARKKIQDLELQLEVERSKAREAATRRDPRIAKALLMYGEWKKHPRPNPAPLFLEAIFEVLIGPPPEL